MGTDSKKVIMPSRRFAFYLPVLAVFFLARAWGENAKCDSFGTCSDLAVTDDASTTPRMLRVAPATGRLLVDSLAGGGVQQVDLIRGGGVTITAAEALSDTTTNPTAILFGSHTLAFTGASWIRVRGTVANGLQVDVTRSALPTGAATEATLGTLSLSQATAIAGAKLAMVGGSVSTAAPTYATGTIEPLSLTLGGRLRVETVGGAGAPATYGVSALAVSPDAAGATDVVTLTGSGTKTVRVLHVAISGRSTAAAGLLAHMIKRSTANSGGTSSGLTETPYDSASASATATALSYTANPTLGTQVGHYASARFTTTTTAGAAMSRWEWLAPTNGAIGQPIVLRGTDEVLAVNLAASNAAVAGLTIEAYITWTEE